MKKLFIYEISTHVHTHPSSGGIGLSSGDAQMYDLIRRPIHILYNKKLYEAIYHGKESGWSYTNKGGW
jgi:hypothetical protein